MVIAELVPAIIYITQRMEISTIIVHSELRTVLLILIVTNSTILDVIKSIDLGISGFTFHDGL